MSSQDMQNKDLATEPLGEAHKNYFHKRMCVHYFLQHSEYSRRKQIKKNILAECLASEGL